MTAKLYEDLAYLLRNQLIPILSREGEDGALELLDSLGEKKETVKKTVKILRSKASRELHLLHDCTNCSTAIAPKLGSFSVHAELEFPILILIHNEKPLSLNQYYNDPQENMLFIKMITKIFKVDPKKILIREVLRCYFSENNLFDPANLERCMEHLKEEIKKHSIKGVLAIGSAAKILFSDINEFQNRYQESSIWMGLPFCISPGPKRILYLENKRVDIEVIIKEKKNIQSIWNSFLKEVVTH